MAGNGIGWYGPLIDVSQASSHVGDYVQLLVFVHTSVPILRYKASAGGALLRTDIQVADDTRPYFTICIWQKKMGSLVSAGDAVLLQNVKIQRIGDNLEAVTVHLSTMLILAHRTQLLGAADVEEILSHCNVGRTTKEKLKKVIQWVKRSGFTFHSHQQENQQMQMRRPKNWTTSVEKTLRDCVSVSELLSITSCCNAKFSGYVGEILLSSNHNAGEELDAEKFFISKRLFMKENSKIVEDVICSGCKLCGFTLESRGFLEQDGDPLYCGKSSNHHHSVGYIYRPFLLYVWDSSEYVPLLTKNKAAEVLFGNISAENIYRSSQGSKDPDFCAIWFILLKLLLEQNKNSPLRFEVAVSCGVQTKRGDFELIDVEMPCYARTYPHKSTILTD